MALPGKLICQGFAGTSGTSWEIRKEDGELFAYTVYRGEKPMVKTVSPLEAYMILRGHDVDFGDRGRGMEVYS